ncbi:MAG: type II secretion system GspH family protein [Synergistaceae bacterium]|jgi:prepilin-type N-terminal cleavage/methylation domain-containing protein|nr:type II secretion system GspH family protein [Synergistaceae bacterium]
MTRQSRARQGNGFTLVELLIVIMIIAALAGMVLFAFASAASVAESAKVINDIRNLKGAALLFFESEGNWPSDGNYVTGGGDSLLASLDRYVDRAFLTVANSRYGELIIKTITDPSTGAPRGIIGVRLRTGENGLHTPNVLAKLAGAAQNANLMKDDGTRYEAPGEEIFTSMR